MKAFDINRPVTAKELNESLFKQFNVKINFEKYSREQLENYRNLLRTKVHHVESQANFNDLLTNETYQKDKYMLGVLNTKIKEMIGESKLKEAFDAPRNLGGGLVLRQDEYGPTYIMNGHKLSMQGEHDSGEFQLDGKPFGDYTITDEVCTITRPNGNVITIRTDEKSLENFARRVLGKIGDKVSESTQYNRSRVISEKAVSKAQQQAAGIALAAKEKGKKPAGKGAAAAMAKMSTKELRKIAGTKHKGLPKHKTTDESIEERTTMRTRKAKPDFLDLDKDGDKTEPMKSAAKSMKSVKEAAKPDFLDLDKDGNKKEPMKKAAKDAKKCCCKTKGKKACPVHSKSKKAVKEEAMHRAYQKFIAESVAYYLMEDEEGKAKAITAAADMVNDFTSWMQRVGNYQTKSMIELADSIRANFGVQESETFKQSVGSALEGALNSLTTAREEINNAVAVLAGEAPAEKPMGPEPEMGEEPEMATDQMNPAADEFAASDAAAGGPETTGRLKRESIERGNRLMKILGS